MKVEIFDKPYDPWQIALQYQEQHLVAGKYGAMNLFVGTMRDFNAGDAVNEMMLEYYPEMTQSHLEQIATDALSKFAILDVIILHRVGRILPNDPIVCVAVWSAHRAAAYDANRFVMEDLKAKAPFWKKETLAESERWVEKNTC